MEIRDSRELVQDIIEQGLPMVTVRVDLPDYFDMVTILAMEKRFIEICQVCDVKIRMVGETSNLAVEKAITRIFALREDIYTTITWKEK